MQKRSADRSAGPLRWLGAALTGLLPTPTTPVQINLGLSLSLDEKRGSRQSLLMYPVATMEGPHVHEGSRDNLLGQSPTVLSV